MRYIPHTPEDIQAMLAVIGVDSIDELFRQIPADLQLAHGLDVPPAMSEPDLVKHVQNLALLNEDNTRTLTFLGSGVHHHHIPTAVSQLLFRGEFFTAYTPYQPEISQGTLQAIFEFQTMVAELLGVEIANASLYDGSTGLGEAALMARRCTRRSKILISAGVHPEYRNVVDTYVRALDAENSQELIPLTDEGSTDINALETLLSDDTAAVIVQHPNFFGTLEDVTAIAERAHQVGALCVATFTDPFAFGVLEAPGLSGADIVAGEGQGLGVPMSFGGPLVGFFGCGQKVVRQMPGRLCGRTVDKNGQDGYVLTLSTREQHIRRERATSNICTNQGLMALASCITMVLLGPDGLERAARLSFRRAHDAQRRVCELDGYSPRYGGHFFHEFVVQTPQPAQAIVDRLSSQGIVPGLPLSTPALGLSGREHELLISTTELHGEKDIDRLVNALAG
jgi:glycine dehydrogenase subunit 1